MFAQLQQLTQTLVSSPVIVLADQQETEEVGVAFRAGVRGYITTYLRAELVVDAIRMVLAGGTFFPVDALRQSRPTLQREIKPDPSSSRQPDGREVPTRLLVKIGQGEQNEGQAQDVAPDREHETEQENAEEWSGLQNRAEQDVEKQNSAQSQGQAGEPWPLRQLSVLNLLLRGKANREIGSLLGMEESVVKVHLRLIMRKLGASNRTEAALFASRLGLVAVCERACASVNSGR
jgi:DNA-binding NarL/FixJ family response regulator